MEFAQEKLESLMRLAFAEVEKAIESNNTPFGALLVDAGGNVVVSAYNTCRETMDPTAHAEINLLRKAALQLKTKHFDGYAVVVSGEPCSMCASAMIRGKIQDIFYGGPHEAHLDPQLTIEEVAAKAVNPIHVVGGILADESREQLLRGRAQLKK